MAGSIADFNRRIADTKRRLNIPSGGDSGNETTWSSPTRGDGSAAAVPGASGTLGGRKSESQARSDAAARATAGGDTATARRILSGATPTRRITPTTPTTTGRISPAEQQRIIGTEYLRTHPQAFGGGIDPSTGVRYIDGRRVSIYPAGEQVDILGQTIVPSKDKTTGPMQEAGLLTVTTEQAEELRRKASSKQYWEVSGEISPTEGIEESEASSRVRLVKSPLGFETAGTFETNWANIITSRKEFEARKGFEKESKEIGKQFQADPTQFTDSEYFKKTETDTGITYGLDEGYFKALPSYKKYSAMFDDTGSLKSDIYAESVKEAREMRTSGKDMSWDQATEVAKRNVRLTLGEQALWVPKTGVGFAEFGISIAKEFGSREVKPGEKIDPFKIDTFSFAESAPDSFIGKISAAQYTPSTSGFNLLSPSTYSQAGGWIKELPSRPGTALTTGLIAGSLFGVTRATAQSYVAERGVGATRWGATGTITTEALSSISPLKIRPGIYGTGMESPKDVAAYNLNREGFIEIKVSGKATGWETTPTRLKPDEVISSRTLFKNTGGGSEIKYPGETLTGVARGSEEVFIYAGSKYGWGGLNPSFTGLRIPTVTYIPPITDITSTPLKKISGGGQTDIIRAQYEFTKFPVKYSRYDFALGDKSSVTLQRGGGISVPTSKLDLKYSTEDIFFTQDIARKTNVYFRDPISGVELARSGKWTFPSRTSTKLTATSKTDVTLGTPKEVPEELASFEFKGETLVDKYGKIREGIVYPSTTTSTVRTYGPRSVSEVLRGSSKTFIPDMKFGGGVGGGSGSSGSVGGSTSSSGGGQVSLFGSSGLSGKWASFNAPIYSSTSSAAFVPSAGPLSVGGASSGLGYIGASIFTPTSVSSQSNIQSSVSVSSQISSQATTQVSSQISSQATTQASSQASIVSQITAPITSAITTAITMPSIVPTIGSSTRPPKIPFNFFGFPPVPPPKFGFPQSRPVKIYKKQQGYLPQAKTKGGKWITLSSKPMSRNAALSRASRATDNTLSAQFRIKKAKGKVKPSMDNYFGVTKNKYRPYKIKKGQKISLANQFIEKKGSRIDSRGEVKGLKLAKYAKDQGWLTPTKKKGKKTKKKSPWLF